jgi:hypothetical protein
VPLPFLVCAYFVLCNMMNKLIYYIILYMTASAELTLPVVLPKHYMIK